MIKEILHKVNLSAIAFLAVFISLTFAQELRAQYSGGTTIDKIVAKVDNYIVLRSDLEAAFLESQRDPNVKIGRCDVLRQLVIEKVLLAKAEIDSVVVSDDEVNANLDRRLQAFISRYGRENIEEQFGKSVEEFRDELRGDIRDQLTAQQMQQTITQDVKVTPSEVRKFFQNIPQDSLPFYSTEVTVGQIVKLPTVSKDQKDITRKKLLEIRERILSGESFAELAEEYSEDPGSAVQGGELGYMERGQLVPEYEATALQMQPGELSQPVESEYGFHLIQLIERRGNRYNSRHILLKPNSSDLDIKNAEVFLDSLRDKIMNDTLDFAKAAKEHSDDKETAGSGGFFMSQDGSNRVSTDQIDPVVFFAIDTMEIGDITPPLEYRMPDGRKAVRMLYYKDRTRPHQANLKDDYQKIYDAALQERKTDALRRWFNSARDEVFIEIDPEYSRCDITGSI
ncbi:peptidylprolyl isomerase [Catalinimonas sp. 4WD22]|uniref:peptidylprolyl isomerase n=1 Tax=Catalinimonas locisalis TaxID=3133978 RepID=UPI0031019627